MSNNLLDSSRYIMPRPSGNDSALMSVLCPVKFDHLDKRHLAIVLEAVKTARAVSDGLRCRNRTVSIVRDYLQAAGIRNDMTQQLQRAIFRAINFNRGNHG